MQNNTLEYDNQLYMQMKNWIKKLKWKIFFPKSLGQNVGVAKYGI